MPGMEVYAREQSDSSSFELYLAQLESIAKGREKSPPDQMRCFELLQQMTSCAERTEKKTLKELQRKAEDIVMDILLNGCCPSVRWGSCPAGVASAAQSTRPRRLRMLVASSPLPLNLDPCISS